MSRSANDQLIHFLSDMYSVELQALAQLVTAPDMAGDPALAEDYKIHHAETEQQEAMVRGRLEELGGSSSAVKNAVMKLGGKGFLLFARLMPETPGRLAVHSYSYEAMEWAGYELLLRFAERAGDQTTANLARSIRGQERTMMERLARGFPAAEAASHRDTPLQDMGLHVIKHLGEAHALESQNIVLLRKSDALAGSAELERMYDQHLDETRAHADLLERRLNALGADESHIKDGALATGGFNWGLFFQAQSDTPAKLAAFAYAVEHLEIGGYEMLRLSAGRAGDTETQALCDRIVAQERAMAEKIAARFDQAVDATFHTLNT